MSTSSTTDHEHRARLQLLQRLLKSLPNNLPEYPQESSLSFGLDPEDIKDEGYYFAANRNFELCFATWKKGPGWDGALEILERGRRWDDFLVTVRKVLKMEKNEGNKKLLVEKWVERLITAAKKAGGKIPTRTHGDSDEDEDRQPKLTARFNASASAVKHLNFVVLSSDSEIEVIQPPSKRLKLAKRNKAVVVLDDESSDSDIVIVDLPAQPVARPSASSSKGVPTPSNSSSGPRNLEQKTLLNWGQEGHRARKFSAAQRMRIEEGRKAQAEEEMLRQERAKEKKRVKKREQGRLRVAKHRKLKKSQEAAGKGHQRSAGRRAKKMVLNGDRSQAGGLENIAEVSRPKGLSWRQERNGKRGGVVQRRHSRVNWQHPLLWARIAKVAPTVCFSATLIVRILQQQDRQLYSTLHKGTVQHWLSKSGRGWSKRTMKKVHDQSTVAGSGKVGVLTPYPSLVTAIIERLKGMRESGLTVSRALARSVMIAMIHKEQPQLLNASAKLHRYCRY
ncbi:hypothetical protein PQX77_016954 [Marasmius sp. AFHP31]|nr:hypothetical protein PQX77_016954 [Marasmius sp. AFHP31]